MQKKKFNKNRADKLWSDLVKLIAGGRCEYCGKAEYPNSHHVFSRSNLNLRWDTDNGVCLCVGHHVFGNLSAHKSPIEFLEWLKEKRGNEWYERLRSKARVLAKFTEQDKVDISIKLKQMIRELEIEKLGK